MILCWFLFLFYYMGFIIFPSGLGMWTYHLTDEKIESERIPRGSKLQRVYVRRKAEPQLKTMAIMVIVLFFMCITFTILHFLLYEVSGRTSPLSRGFELSFIWSFLIVEIVMFSRVMSPRLHGRCYRQGTMYLKEIVRETKTPAFNSSELLVSDGEHDLHCSFFALLKAKLKPGKKIDCLYATGGKSFRITKITDPSSATDSVFHDKEGHSGYRITGRVCDVDYALIRVFGFVISLYKIDTDILLSDYSVGDCVEIVIGGLSVPRT